MLRLRAAVQARAAAELEIAIAVGEMRMAGYSWSAVGMTLGTSAQGAGQRYRSAAGDSAGLVAAWEEFAAGVGEQTQRARTPARGIPDPPRRRAKREPKAVTTAAQTARRGAAVTTAGSAARGAKAAPTPANATRSRAPRAPVAPQVGQDRTERQA